MALLEERTSRPAGAFDLRDHFAAWGKPLDAVVPAEGAFDFEAVAIRDANANFLPLAKPLRLKTLRGSTDYHGWMGLARRAGDDYLRREPFAVGEIYRIRIGSAGGRYSTAYADLVLAPPPPPPAPPPRQPIMPFPEISLQPGLAYPFRERQPAPAPGPATPAGTGPTLLSGHFDDAKNSLVLLVDANPPNDPVDLQVATRCLADGEGRWTISFNRSEPLPQNVFVAVVPEPDLTGSWVAGELQTPFPAIDLKSPPQFPPPVLIRGRQTTFPSK